MFPKTGWIWRNVQALRAPLLWIKGIKSITVLSGFVVNYCFSGGQAAWIACHISACSPFAEGNIESSKLTSFEPYWTRPSFQPSLPSFDHVATQNFPPVDLLQMFHPPLWLWELTHLVTSMNLKDGFWTRFHHVFQQELIIEHVFSILFPPRMLNEIVFEHVWRDSPTTILPQLCFLKDYSHDSDLIK